MKVGDKNSAVLIHNKHRFIQYLWRDHVAYYRCTKYPFKCLAKIRIDEKLKYAEMIGKHIHNLDTMRIKSKAIKVNIKTEPKSPPTLKGKAAILIKPLTSKTSSESLTSKDVNDEFAFNKDVTTDVELITNDRDVTCMFLKGFKFTKYFESKIHTSYRCVHYPKQTADCQARIKHNTDFGEVLMRSEHNHPVDDNTYKSFLDTAVKVRKFTKKTPRALKEQHPIQESKKILSSITNSEAYQDIGDFALAMTRMRSEMEANISEPADALDESLLIEVKEDENNT